MRQLNIPLSANKSFDVYESGEYIRILDAPGGAVLVECSQPAIFAQLQEGQSIRVGSPFSSLRITNGATPQTVVVIIGTGEFSDNTFSGAVTVEGVAQVAGAVSITGTAGIVNTRQDKILLNGLYSIVTGVFVQYLAARVGRKTLRIAAMTNVLKVSFDGGTNYVNVHPSDALIVDGYEGAVHVADFGTAAGCSLLEGY